MSGDRRIFRHRLWVRLTHWINVVCMTVLLMSGLQIFNAHPALYWGDRSRFDQPILSIGAERDTQGHPMGVTMVGTHAFNTTGLLGVSGDPADEYSIRAFPAWATLPGLQWLAMGRRWHFFFAWIFVVNAAAYATLTVASRHLWRDLLPSRSQLRRIGHSLWDHLRLRFPRGEEAKQYNVVQKLAYLVVILVLGPVTILAGLAMSPRLDASYPLLLDVFGGRQSARTIHFICAFSLLGFVLIHVAMVVVSGVWNNLRSMITGWYDLGGGKGNA
jgi:thiosulfate reductase cytochrome b subunit